MPAFICNGCGAQFPDSKVPPPACPLCLDDRHLVHPAGQNWTTLDTLARKHYNAFRQHEPDLIGIGSIPAFAIGQRALLARTPAGNVLWDCISLIDPITVDIIKGLGGLVAIAVSHPHYYSGMVDWSRAFGGVPIYVHAADRQWITRPDPAIELWAGDTLAPVKGFTLIHVGGHFAGGTVAHWDRGSEGKGSLLAGDLVMIVADKKWVSFMRSYPNIMPLAASTVEQIGRALEPFRFEAIHGPFFDRLIAHDGAQIVQRSVQRYVKTITGDGSADRL